MKQVADPGEMQHLLKGAEIIGKTHPGVLAIAQQLRQDYDFDGINLVLPTTLFDERYTLDLDGTKVHLIYVGACHQLGDTIVHVPKEGVVFAGDVIFTECTSEWLDRHLRQMAQVSRSHHLTQSKGHCPRTWTYVRDRRGEGDEGISRIRTRGIRRCFKKGLTSLEASKQIDLGAYGKWHAPARLYLNVERAYREFRKEPADAPWDKAMSFDLICEVAKAKGIEVEF